jgi:hypothetical protein
MNNIPRRTCRNRILSLTGCIAFVLLLIMPVTVNAQDVIVRKNGRRIEAIVREITSEQVRYNIPSDPDGRTYFVYRDLVASIEYENGKTVTLDGATIESPATQAKQDKSVSEQPKKTVSTTERPKTAKARTTEPERKPKTKQAEIEEKTFSYYNRLTEDDIQEIFDLPTSMDYYRKSSSFNRAGTGMIIGGAILALAPVGNLIAENHYGGKLYFNDFFGKQNYPVKKVTNAVGIIGGVAILGGIGLKLYSIQLKNDAKSIKSVSDHPSRKSSLNFHVSGNGAGFVMNF